MLSDEATESIFFAEKEIAGSVYLDPLMDLEQAIYQVVDNSRHPDGVEASKRAEIEEVTARLTEIDSEYSDLLQLSDRWINIQSKVSSAVQGNSDWASVLGDIKALRAHVGDYSNLILDPDLDSYYLMDAVLLRYPPLHAQLSRLQHNLERPLASDDLRLLIHDLQRLSDEANLAITTAMGHNGTLASSLQGGASDIHSQVFETASIIDHALTSGNIDAAKQHVSGISMIMEQVWEYTSDVNTNLRDLLNLRIERDAAERTRMLIMVLASITAGIAISIIVLRSLTGSIREAATSAKAISQDQLETEVIPRGSGEPRMLLNSLENMRKQLLVRISKERAQATVNAGIRHALECVTRAVVILDISGNITYGNRAAQALITSIDDPNRESATHGDDSIEGRSIDFLLTQDENALAWFRSPVGDYTFECTIGHHLIIVVMNCVDGIDHEVENIVVELKNRTREKRVENAVEKDILGIVNTVISGKLDGQIDSTDKPKFLAPVYDGINKMITLLKDVTQAQRSYFEKLSQGDFSTPMRGDYQGVYAQLQQDTETMRQAITSMLKTVDTVGHTVLEISHDVSISNTSMESLAGSSSNRAESSRESVSEISQSLDSVASATEEMSSSIRHIAENSQSSSAVAKKAVALSEDADAKVAKLAESSQTIGVVLKSIQSIAEQTNLLALNATIEAARAGVAGKGFAVVANEVKELAKNTSEATQEISSHIAVIAKDGEDASSALAEIRSIIEEIDALQDQSASALTQQSVTTEEITQALINVNTGVSVVSEESNKLLEDSRNTYTHTVETKLQIEKLSTVAEELRDALDRFQLDDFDDDSRQLMDSETTTADSSKSEAA